MRMSLLLFFPLKCSARLVADSSNANDGNSKGGVPPPGAAISARKMKLDSRAEPEYGERVPYLIMASEAGLRQVNRAITPAEFLADPYVLSYLSSLYLCAVCTVLKSFFCG